MVHMYIQLKITFEISLICVYAMRHIIDKFTYKDRVAAFIVNSQLNLKKIIVCSKCLLCLVVMRSTCLCMGRYDMMPLNWTLNTKDTKI